MALLTIFYFHCFSFSFCMKMYMMKVNHDEIEWDEIVRVITILKFDGDFFGVKIE